MTPAMHPVQENSRWPRVSKFTLSACAATVAELVTFPLDLTKTRLQIQGEGGPRQHGSVQPPKYRGMLSTAMGIVREEGPLKLWRGVTPAIYRHIVYSGGRMLAYEQLRESVLGRSEDGIFPVWKAVIGSMISGALGQFIASPTDLVKVQMQMEGRRRLEGKPPRVHGVYHAFTKIIAEGGIRGLWAGWVPNVQRAALVNLGDLMTYDTVKHFLLRNTSMPDTMAPPGGGQGFGVPPQDFNWPHLATPTKNFWRRHWPDNSICHGLASICSGLVAATMGTPADVVKTRVMNQPRDSNGRGLLYKSSTDCLVQSVRREGFFSLYKGFLPTWFRMAPWSLTFWLTFEQMRRAMGISSF
ncbi:mitochondrial uncoupling protein [Pimephales promelas]|nr:mitochondrial uncoupling protein [Pimephales promelas]